MTENKSLELYLHIPFCVRKCDYCDFLSFPAGKELQGRYMEALIREVAGRASEGEGYLVSSIFFGGGTPSLVEPVWIERTLETIRRSYRVSEHAEVTLEMNPGTVTGEGLKCYRRAGVNRLSIGLQSSDDAELRGLGRIHTFSQFLTCYQEAREAGFSNINVDVMSALPGQSLTTYEKTLKTIVSLSPAPEHISAYSLIVEEGTPFYARQEAGELPLPDEETERRMYELTEEFLRQYGYYRYEISNYAREGFACRHNCGYWSRTEYLGFGIGAASLMKEHRFRNGEELSAYLEEPLGVRTDEEALSEREQMAEFMFLGLRMTEGVSRQQFYEKFHRELLEVYGEEIKESREEKLLECAGDRIRLTGRGLDVSNYVMAKFI